VRKFDSCRGHPLPGLRFCVAASLNPRPRIRPVRGLAHTDTGEGPPVVLLHGLTCHLGYWLRVMPHLAGLRVVALDFRGHGLSEHTGSYRFADYEHDLFELLDGLGLDSAPIAGHSLGGYVALSAATRSDRIARVLAIDVKCDWTEDDEALAGRSGNASQRVEADREAALTRLAKSIAPVALGADELETLAERSLEPVEEGWLLRWDRRVLASEPVDPFAFLRRVSCPVQVLAGAQSDVMPPERARRFADAIPGAALELVDDVGHHVELEAPELVARRIRELALAGET
jgi:pimeloyl-ACP methyl ester carboxylesterase